VSMAVIQTYERINHGLLYSMGGIDLFAGERSAKPAGPILKPIVPPLLGAFRFYITHRLTAPVAAYEPPYELISWSNRSGFFLFSGEMRAQNRPGTLTLNTGRYRWRVESDYYRPVEFDDVWPPASMYDSAKDLKLLPAPNYPFPDLNLKQRAECALTLLRGTILNSAAQPMEKVKIELIAPDLPPPFITFKECFTDGRGEWVLALIEKKQRDDIADRSSQPDFAHSRIRVSAPGNEYAVDLSITPGVESSLRQTALRGRIVKPGGSPISGAKITTSVGSGHSVSRIDGQWIFYFELRQDDGPVTVTATTPDGRTASQNSRIVQRTTEIVPTIEIS
jgi:hypothetical protein